MYKGYLEYGGTEIANAQRVAEYVRKNAPHIPLRVDATKHAKLNEALGEELYESPAADNAPWVDPYDPASRRFLGVYPIDISGIDGSTRTAATIEAIGNGGMTGRVRHGSKAVRVTAMLVAEDAEALDVGATWLSRALDSDDCSSSGGSCSGANLCFYSAKPNVCDEWEPTYQAGFSRPLGVTETSSPLILRDGGEHIFKARLDEGVTSSKEGVVVEWGTVLRDNTNVWDERYGPVVLRRRNLMRDPNFDAGGAGWSAATFPTEGGSDGGAYAFVEDPIVELGPLDATNIANDPSFQATLGPDVQRTNLDPDPARVLTAWEADNMPTGAPTFHSDGGPDELPFDTYARYTMTSDDDSLNGGIRFNLGAPTIGAIYTASMWIRLDEEQVIKVRWAAIDGGASGETTNVTVPADTWTRVGITTAALPAGTTQVRFTIETPVGGEGHIWMTGNTFDHTGGLIEQRRFIDEFFYGGMADTSDAVYDFTGTVNNSTSTLKRYRAVTSVVGTNRETYRHTAAAREGAYGQRTVITAPSADTTVQMTTQGPSIGGNHTATFWVISRNREVTITPRIRGNDGTPVAVPQGVWTKIRSEVVAGGASSSSTGMRIAGAQVGDIIDADIYTLVAGSYLGDPFTGATPASGGYAYAWSGAANASTSLRYATIATEYLLDSPTFVAPSGPAIASLALRSLVGASVVVQMLRESDDSIISEALLSPDDEWQRYSFPATGGVSSYLHFIGDAPFEVDEVLVEIGRIELPYFDGDTPWEQAAAGYIVGGMETPEYSVGWVGQPETSESVMEWLGDMTIGIPFGGDFALQTGACNVWPRIDVLQGELSGGYAAYALRMKVPTDRQVQPLERTLFDVTCVSGPTPLRDLEFDNGSAMRIVEFILVAGKPFAYGSPVNMVYPSYGSQFITVPWTDPECPATELVPISDPLCPPPPAPPRPPAIAATCVPPETTWERYWYDLPASSVAGWSEMVPVIKVRADIAPVRHMRVRFYPNPFDRTPEEIDPCSWCSEYVLSYVPADTDVEIDAALERSTASVAAGPWQPYDTFVVSTDGEPLEWSSLSCGIGYLVAVDFPTGSEGQTKFGLDLMRRV